MLREFDARLLKGDNRGAWTCVVMDDVGELFGTRGLSHTRASLTIARKLARRSYHVLRELGPTALQPVTAD